MADGLILLWRKLDADLKSNELVASSATIFRLLLD
jgi:hypothetical protein